MIKPTVGRKVWYRPCANDRTGPMPMNAMHGQPLDATIVAVWNDRMVNVQVLDCYAKPFLKTSITLKQEGDEMPKDADGNELGGYVEWMPYQNSQANKAAA